MKKGLLIFCSLIIATSLHAQLQELEAIPIENPDRAIPVFTNYPDEAALIIRSTIPNLQIDSNIGLVADLSEPGSGEYRLIVRPLRQTISVSGPGFLQQRFNVNVTEARQVIYYLVNGAKSEVPVLFRVDQDDAVLYLNDQEFTDLSTPKQIPVGNYNLRIEADGFRTITESIYVTEESILFEYEMIEIDPILLTISTSLPGSRIQLDGFDVGVTDSQGKLQLFRFPGYYQLRVSLSGYSDQTKTIEIVENQTNEFNFNLLKNSGTVLLNVSPEWAHIHINSEPIRNGTAVDLSPGRYRIEVKTDGYLDYTEDFQIESSQAIEKNISLVRLTGKLQLNIIPSYTDVLLLDNGIEVEKFIGSKFINSIYSGTHAVIMKADGYELLAEWIDIQPNQTNTFTFHLEEVQPKVTLTDGLIAFFPFQDNLVNIVTNNSFTARRTTSVRDRFNNENSALGFSRSIDYLILGDTFDLSTSNSFSIELWLKPEDLSNDMAAFSKRLSNEPFTGFEFWANDDQTPMVFSMDFGGSSMVIEASSRLLLKQWNHVVITRDGQSASIFLNGKDVTSRIIGARDNPLPNTEAGFFIGRGRTSGFGFDGSIDDFRIYNRALNENTILDLYEYSRSTEY